MFVHSLVVSKLLLLQLDTINTTVCSANTWVLKSYPHLSCFSFVIFIFLEASWRHLMIEGGPCFILLHHFMIYGGSFEEITLSVHWKMNVWISHMNKKHSTVYLHYSFSLLHGVQCIHGDLFITLGFLAAATVSASSKILEKYETTAVLQPGQSPSWCHICPVDETKLLSFVFTSLFIGYIWAFACFQWS